MKNLTPLYDQLTPKERFDLSLIALSKDNRPEFNRLVQTCPKKIYTMHDADFSDRREFSIEIVNLYSFLVYEQIIKFLQVRVCINYLGNDLDEKKLTLEQWREEVTAVFGVGQKVISELKAIHEAYQLFCNENEIDADALLNVFALPLLKHIENYKVFIELAKPDPDYFKLVKSKFDELWK